MTRAIRRALIAITGAAMGLTACSSTISGHGSGAPAASITAPSPSGPPSTPTFPSTTPSTTPTTGAAGGGDNAGLSAPDLAQATKAAMTSATAFQMAGTGSDGSQQIAFDIHYGETSSRGRLTLNGQHVQLLNSGSDIYMKGDRKFWEQFAGASDGSVVQFLQGKWVHIPADSPGLSQLGAIAVREEFLAKVASSPDTGGYTTGPSKTIDGVPAVSFVSGDDGSVIYVPATGTPFPIRIENHGSSAGSFDLSGWNVPFTAAPPPSEQIVELPH